MSAMASQITSLTIVYSTIYSGTDKKTSELRVTGLCAGNSPVTGEFPDKGPVTRKMFPFDEGFMDMPQVLKNKGTISCSVNFMGVYFINLSVIRVWDFQMY